MEKRFRALLVGYGYWGVNLLRNLTNSPNFEVVGVIERSPEARAKCARVYPHVPSFVNFDEAVAKTKPEAVVIATPPDSHAPLALKALAAGCHVLIEKPMALNAADCDAVLAEARRQNRIVMVDHTFVYHPAVTCLSNEIHSGRMGDLLYYDSVRINLGGFQITNVMWDLAPHDLSIIDLFTGGKVPRKVSAFGVKHFGAPSETMCYVNMIYDDNFIAHLHLNWAAPVKVRQIMLGGTKKMAIYDDNQPSERVRIYDKGVSLENRSVTDLRINYRMGDMVAPMIPQTEALAQMVSDFARAMESGQAPKADGESGRRVVLALEAISKSLELGGAPVDVVPGFSVASRAA